MPPMAASPITQARELLDPGRASEAEPLLRKYLHKKPRDIAAIETLGLVMTATGRLAEAAEQLVAAAQTPLATARCMCLAIDAAAARGNHDAALAIATISTERFPDDAECWHLRGRTELSNADADLSKGSFPVPDQLGQKYCSNANPSTPKP